MPHRWNWVCVFLLAAGLVVPAASVATADESWPAWTTSKFTGSPLPPSPYETERVFAKLKPAFTNPVVLTDAPGTDRLFLVELTGRIYSFPVLDDQGQEQPSQADLFADLGKAIDGLTRVYGLTFAPDYPRDPHCYVCYVLAAESPDGTRVSRFRVTPGDPPRLATGSEQLVLSWKSGGHNGGCLKFGPDGYLYISAGDGGPAFPPDPLKSGQDVGNLLSTIMRIDVRGGSKEKPYRIPPDNPLVDTPGARGEVWCYGLRNPWKMSFDSATGDLWVGDVGWELWEMIYRVRPGGNYGWSLVEGRQPVHRERSRGPTPVLPPTIEHSHTESRSITGGFVYRGQRLPELVGSYIYGDYVTGKIWAARVDDNDQIQVRELVDTSLAIICFGVDRRQELYVVGYDGSIHRLNKRPAAAANANFPRRLSETGLFTSVARHQPAPGVLRYQINAPAWADGAVSERLLGLPHRQPLGIHEKQNVQVGTIKGNWRFPVDGVLAKTISMPVATSDSAATPQLRRLETQVLHLDGDTWRGYSYLWNRDQTDAELAPPEGAQLTMNLAAAGGKPEPITWNVPGRTQCLLCHTTRSGSLIAFHPEQLQRPGTAETEPGQLERFAAMGVLAQPVAKTIEPMPDPYAAAGDEPSRDEPGRQLDARARAYVHVNCAHCHRRGGGGTAAIDVQYQFPMKRTNLLDARPTQGTFGILAAEVFAAGDPYRSVLFYRMAKLGHGRMPYFGSSVVDQRGLQLIRDWIARHPAGGRSARPAVKQLRQQQDRQLSVVHDQAVDQPDWKSAVQQLLGSTSGALRLAMAADQDLAASKRQQIVQLALAKNQPEIGDLFLRYVPPSQRPQRLGVAIRPEAILKLPGDADRGRALFANSKRLQCANCHRIGKTGKPLGPDLTTVGKQFGREQILESILNPSKRIDPKFQTYLVETAGGRVVTGLLAGKTEQEVRLLDATGHELRLASDDVELLAPQQKSLMPELQLRDLTSQEAADLLKYLESLR